VKSYRKKVHVVKRKQAGIFDSRLFPFPYSNFTLKMKTSLLLKSIYERFRISLFTFSEQNALRNKKEVMKNLRIKDISQVRR
jgi:hypothetical protein